MRVALAVRDWGRVSELGGHVEGPQCCWDWISVWSVLLWLPRDKQDTTAQRRLVTKAGRGWHLPESCPMTLSPVPTGPSQLLTSPALAAFLVTKMTVSTASCSQAAQPAKALPPGTTLQTGVSVPWG